MNNPRRPAEDLTRLQVGRVEADPSDLDPAAGSPITDLLAERQLDRTSIAMPEELPTTGWRRIAHRPASSGFGEIEVLATPHPTQPGTWLLARLAEHCGRWSLQVERDPVAPIPGRAQRRADLRLTWPPRMITVAGETPEIHTILTNVGETTWTNVGNDHNTVFGWILDSHGERIQQDNRYNYSGMTMIPTLAPGESVTLWVLMKTPGLESLSPGRYDVECQLFALGLRSELGTLRIV